MNSAMTRRVLAATAASAVSVLGTLLVSAAPAEAICEGKHNGTTITEYYGGHAVAQERQVTGTCDGNGVYSGQLRDMRDDGYAARARYEDAQYEGIVATSGGGWKDYRYTDKSTDGTASYAYVQIYSSPASRPDAWWINSGF